MKVAPISRFTINGYSMLPTLREGQDVLSFNWAYLGKKPKVGDIVVVKVNGKEMVKRIQKVDDRQIFVYGDNMDQSTDSRNFGPVSMDHVIGKLIYSSALPKHGNIIDCPQCGSDVLGIYGRKDAICTNCGFKLSCCGEP